MNSSALLCSRHSLHFEDEPTWTAEALSNETGIAENTIWKRMLYWITHRVVVVMVGEHDAADHHHHHHGNEDAGGGHTTTTVSAATQQKKEHEVYESYISAMLTSLKDGAASDKIHNMLKMMVSWSEMKNNKTPQQLSALLQKLCRQESLDCGPDGTYKLVKKRVGRRNE